MGVDHFARFGVRDAPTLGPRRCRRPNGSHPPSVLFVPLNVCNHIPALADTFAL